MIKNAKRVGVFLFLAAALGILVSKGCQYIPESMFRLASESRLPKWITLPPGLNRADVAITMNYYIVPWGGRAQFILQDAKGQTVAKIVGKDRCGKPLQLKNPPSGFAPGYPTYEVITVNGTTEIMEQRKPEDILYVTDDPAIWKQYREIGCS